MCEANIDNVSIRMGNKEDCDEILRLITELADCENMADCVTNTSQNLKHDMFGDTPLCYSFVAAKENGELAGHALFYPIYSIWRGVCLYLNDLYVSPQFRGQGLGKRLMQAVAQKGLDWKCQRLQLTVLNWNTFANDFYTRSRMVYLTGTEDSCVMLMSRQNMEAFVLDQESENNKLK